MSVEKQVSAAVDGKVMTITIDNPEMKNGLNWVGIGQMTDCLERYAGDDGLEICVVTGNDEYFYTGGRVNPNAEGEQEKYSAAIERYEKVMHTMKKPMIAAISGDCLKAGMSMIASCEVAIAREGVEFGFPEVRMGGVPMLVMVETIMRMPEKKALEYYLTSWNFPAEEAYRMGLINCVVPKEQFWETVEKYIKVYTETPKIIVDLTRKAFYNMRALPDEKARIEFGMEMLRSEVLPAMETIKQQYNV